MDGGKQHQRFVALQSSTGRQAEFGLSIDAQRAAVRNHVAANEGRLRAEFSETVSGGKNDRPQLAMALTTCRIMGAVLVIARLDRLSRNVAMIARLMKVDSTSSLPIFPARTSLRSTYSPRLPNTNPGFSPNE